MIHLHTVERSKAIFHGRSLAGIAGSNLSPVSAVCVQVEISATTDPSSRGVLPTVVCHCV